MATSLSALHAYIPPLLTPVHDSFPFPLLDIFGAMRLSMFVNFIATGVFDPPPTQTAESSNVDGVIDEKANGPSDGIAGSKKRRKATKGKSHSKPRPGLLQELFGIAVVVFGPETFLSTFTGAVPSWLINPKTLLLFWAVHTLQSRTPLARLLPSRPNFLLEMMVALPDAIGRAMLLTRFSVIPLLHPPSASLIPNPAVPKSPLPATPSTLILVPLIMAVPFASLIFTGLNLFSPVPKLTVPMELQPWGWISPDAWGAVVCPVVFLSLIGPVKGWGYGLGWKEEEAIVVVAGILWAAFTARTLYNLGPSWARSFDQSSTKLKTA